VIEEFQSAQQSEVVYRLAALPEPLMRVLLDRGISFESAQQVTEAMQGVVELVTTADEAVRDCFQSHDGYPTAFPIGRFGDGSYGVYYSAIEIATTIEEVAHHRKNEIIELGHPRYFRTLRCSFSGSVLVLIGHETAYPDLISETEDGYPLCQSIAAEALAAAYDALRTPSARRQGGVCLPVFIESSLTDRMNVGQVEMAPDGTGGLRKRQL
jgi:hypothetical protein